MRVLVWNEHRHEQADADVAARYPDGIHGCLAAGLRALLPRAEVATATLDEPEQGLAADRLEHTDVLVWWGHRAHEEVGDVVVARVHQAVLDGMGFVALHSAHRSRPGRALMGTSGWLTWRKPGERERLWVVDPAHPIASGIPATFALEQEEVYGEPFDIPAPDGLVALAWFAGGEAFRAVCAWHRGRGKVAYLQPGDEAYPTYHAPPVQQLVANAAAWAAPSGGPWPQPGPTAPPEPAPSPER
jgi:trehalose utilization protein